MSLDKNTWLETQENPTENIEVGLYWLEKKFSEKYGISLQSLEKIKTFSFEKNTQSIQEDTETQLSKLKQIFENSDISVNDKEAIDNFSNEKLWLFISEIQELNNSSREKLSMLENVISQETNKEILSSNHSNDPLFTKSRLHNVTHPTKPHHHFDWVIVWASKSCIAIGKTVGKICIDTIKTPIDLYKIATNKAYTDQFNNI